MFFFIATYETFKNQEFDLGDYLKKKISFQINKKITLCFKNELLVRRKHSPGSAFFCLNMLNSKICVLHKKACCKPCFGKDLDLSCAVVSSVTDPVP